MATNGGSAARNSSAQRDGGFSLLEVLIVVVILGILASVSTLALRGMADKGAGAVCDNDGGVVASAIQIYQFQHSDTTIPGADAAERMATLVEAGLLNSAAPNFIVESNGDLTPTATCAA